MRSCFPLFQSHLDFAHGLWSKLVYTGDTVLDATSGNGRDALILAKLALSEDAGHLFAIDVQQDALSKTRKHLESQLSCEICKHIEYHHGCHSIFPQSIMPGTVKLIVYNLGYLPGGNKSQTTKRETTLKSLENALPLIVEGGAISITCYPGHPEGKEEEELLLNVICKLAPTCWSATRHCWINRSSAPSIILIQKPIAYS